MLKDILILLQYDYNSHKIIFNLIKKLIDKFSKDSPSKEVVELTLQTI